MSAANDTSFESFLAIHEPQLRASGVSEIFFKSLASKINDQVFDGGEYFQLLLLDYEDIEREEKDPAFTVIALKELTADDPNAIFLIDHALTFNSDTIRKTLIENPALVNRLSIMMGLQSNNDVDKVLHNIWRFSNFYSINAQGIAVENTLPLFYVNDELGSAINHSDEPNFRMVPFMHLPEQITYSLLFPIKEVSEGDQLTRNYVENASEGYYDLLLLPWRDTDFSSESFVQHEPDFSYFLHGRIEESLPETDHVPILNRNEPIKVFSDYEFVNKYLTDSAFEVVDDSEKARILWFTKHFKGFSELSINFPDTFVNQFPFENVVTIKDLLAIVCRRGNKEHHDESTLKTYPAWLPTTYNLNTELKEFVSYYQNRENAELDNYWIIKPYNLARSLDTTITNNLSQIIRLSQTGPKIAQKYIENPVLFKRLDADGSVKFDVRYVILVTSVKPLVVHIYKNFFLRFSNIPFSMSDFDVYEKHFTVMNYGENLVLKHLKCEEFLGEWKEQYPQFAWENIEDDICDMLTEAFKGASAKEPPQGIAHNPQSRGLYATDIMLSWEDGKIQPKLLECNFIPDCKRACEYYPDFYNDIFKLLFLGEENIEVFRRIA